MKSHVRLTRLARFLVYLKLFDLITVFSMPKLYFRHGTVSSAKTLNLLAVSHNYKQQGKKVILLKPLLDNRFGVNEIKSRAGLNQTVWNFFNDINNSFDVTT